MKSLKDQIKDLETSYYQALKKAQTHDELEQVKVAFLGRKGKLQEIAGSMKTLSPDDKRTYGPLFNDLRTTTHQAYEEKKEQLVMQKLTAQEQQEKNFDVTAYKPGKQTGSLHPYTLITKEIEDIFISMGFEVGDGPEVETDYYNFEALNIPGDHPARDMQDTFWLDIPGLLLRTHTSNVQVRAMEHQKPPIAMIVPGRVYRHEATDASHDFMFMQVEGLVVDKNISMAHLLGTMKLFLQKLFGKKIEIRVRTGYFPFVEPGVEIDAECPFCTKGCSVCKQTRWIELSGAGLVHPNVLQCSGIDPNEYSGFAFGSGLTRLAMLKFGINDIRLLHSGKVDFLRQF